MRHLPAPHERFSSGIFWAWPDGAQTRPSARVRPLLSSSMVLGCSTHLVTSVLYFVPVFAFAGWLGLTTLREKRAERHTRTAERSQAAVGHTSG